MTFSPRTFKKPGGFVKKSFGAPRTRSTYAARTSDRPTEFFQATCNGCHKPCEVPFRPNGKKPVYCRDCFKKQEGATESHGAPARFGEREESGNLELRKQFSVLNTKLDKLIAVIEAQTRAIKGE